MKCEACGYDDSRCECIACGHIQDAPYSRTCGLRCSLPFHSWLRNQDQWVIAVAQSDTVYQAMKLSYEANKALDDTSGAGGQP